MRPRPVHKTYDTYKYKLNIIIIESLTPLPLQLLKERLLLTAGNVLVFDTAAGSILNRRVLATVLVCQ